MSVAGTDLWRMSATDLAGAIRSRQASSREVIETHLRRIEAVNPSINAVTILLAGQALEAATAADRAAAAGGDLPPLLGVPFTVKGNIDLAGTPTTQGLKMWAEAYPARDAPHLQRLKAAGAIPIGHTNLANIGVRWHCVSELWGATINPWDRSRTPGASSGGDAAALATGMTPLGVGGDGLGSMRWPAQCCGISALKPTLGRIPRATTIEPADEPIGAQLMVVEGPMARRIADLRAAFEVMAGPSWRDPWTVPAPLRGPAPAKPIRVAPVTDSAGQGTAQQVQEGVQTAGRALEAAGYAVDELEPPSLAAAAQAALAMFNTPEIRAALPLVSLLPADTQRFLSAFYEAAGDPDPAATLQSFMTRQSLLRAWGQFQEGHPLIVAPICTGVPFEAGTDLAEGRVAQTIRGMRMAIAVNTLGLPAVALPVGTGEGLPQSVQVIGPATARTCAWTPQPRWRTGSASSRRSIPGNRPCMQAGDISRKEPVMSVPPTGPEMRAAGPAPPGIDEAGLKVRVAEVVDRWPSAGLAAGVVRGGSLEWFLGHGVANAESKAPVTQDTVFRIGSLTKTFTAIAVMQLWEQGLVDLDAPASDYLRSFRLVPAKASFRPATVRHLLTHTAGVGYWRRLSDLLRPGVGSGDRAGRSGAPPLAEYYRKGLPVEVEPGTKWVYSNHGFAVLGQIVEDVTGQPLDRYLRQHVFGPLGMEHTDLIRSEPVRPRLATGYVLRSGGLKPVADREVPTPGSGGMYSTPADMARYIVALLRGGAGEHGPVLKPATVASMFQPHFQPDPRVPGMGLAFEPGEENGHRTAGKTGTLSGFLSAMVLAPDDGIGVFVLSNTGGLDNRGAPAPLASALLRHVLGLPGQAIRTGIAARPESWSELCGWYSPDPGPVTNLFARALFGAGAEVTVRSGHLMLKPLTPIPVMRRGMRLFPDDPGDPRVFRVEFPEFGYSFRVVFSGGPGDGVAATRLLIDLFPFQKRSGVRNPRRWVNGVAAAGAVALAIRHHRHHGA